MNEPFVKPVKDEIRDMLNSLLKGNKKNKEIEIEQDVRSLYYYYNIEDRHSKARVVSIEAAGKYIEQISKAASKLANLIDCAPANVARAFLDGRARFWEILELAEEFSDSSIHALNRIQRTGEGRGRGRPANHVDKEIEAKLAEIYSRYTGKRAARANNSYTGEVSGDYISFVKMAFGVMKIKASPDSLIRTRLENEPRAPKV